MAFREKLKKIKWKRYIFYAVIMVFLTVCLFMTDTLAQPVNRKWIVLFEKTAIAVMLSVSLSFVVGFLGELSLGHAGFMCIGAYLGGKISVLLEGTLGNSLPNLLISVLAGGVIAAIAGFIIGLPALRLKGDYLAIVTLAFCEIVHTLFKNSSRESFGGAFGLETPRYDRKYLYVIAFLFVMLTFAVLQNIIRSKHGRAVTAIRDNEIAARATGINVTKYKLMVFAVSAFFAGVAGVFFSFSNYTVVDTTFTYNYSIEILVMVVLGGMGNMVGSAISAVLITFLNDQLTNVLTGNLAVLQKLFYAVILVALVIYRNAPGLQGFRDKYNFRALSQRLKRKKDDPSKVKEDAGYWDRVPTKIEMDEILSTDVKVESNSSVRKDGDR
ncbi:MAG TPA: amino acid ABC transporter permease [Clostridiales bacterium]|nr:amino acid ABC transporter permease [Clostridiales bacterium]